jgi:hypothetical protein
MFKDIPGYTLEQFFNIGSQELQVRLENKADGFDELVDQLRGIVLQGIHPPAQSTHRFARNQQ